jgi:hypothetical protein
MRIGEMPAPSRNLIQPRWKSVCAGAQVFRKNYVKMRNKKGRW